MSKRKQMLLILAGMAVLLAALGILLGMVLSSDQQQNQPVAVDTESGSEEVSSNVSRVSKFPPATYISVPENHTPQLSPDPPMPDNFDLDSPPPSIDQLQPGAMEEVGYLTYKQPALSLNDTEDCRRQGEPLNRFAITHEEYQQTEYLETELVSIEDALKAENLILYWQYDYEMWGLIQINHPVQYYRVKDYEPVTVIGVTVGSDMIPRRIAIRNGKIQSAMF